MLYGLLGLSLKGYLIAILILTQCTIASVTIYLHRNQSHLALKLHPIASHFFRFWLWMATGIKTIEWVSIHRKHHAKCETMEDPHSPKNWGLKTMLLRGTEVYPSVSLQRVITAHLGKQQSQSTRIGSGTQRVDCRGRKIREYSIRKICAKYALLDYQINAN